MTILVSLSIVHAQTPIVPPTDTNNATVASDYATDVKTGEASIANDVIAKNNQKEIADNEQVEGKEEDEAAEPQEAIEPEEAEEPQEAIENESEGEGGSEDSVQQSGEQPSGTNGTNETGQTSGGTGQSEGN